MAEALKIKQTPKVTLKARLRRGPRARVRELKTLIEAGAHPEDLSKLSKDESMQLLLGA